MSGERPGQAASAPAAGVWVNGHASTQVSAFERALHYGDGLFETIGCVGGRPRFLELHLTRLATGSARLGIGALDAAALRAEIGELAAPRQRAVVKVLISRGISAGRGYGVTGEEQPTRVTFRYDWPADDPALARDGVRVRIAELRLGENPQLAGLKHCNRLEQVLARSEPGASEVAESLLFSASGALISGTMSNVFLGRDGQLATPRLDRCGVAGVMRHVVREIATRAGIAIEERELRRADLERTDELFLTNALIGIRPVRELAGRALAPGPLTRALQQLLAPLLEGSGGLGETASHG